MSPPFSWIYVLCSAVDILARAAHIRAAQAASRTPVAFTADHRKRGPSSRKVPRPSVELGNKEFPKLNETVLPRSEGSPVCQKEVLPLASSGQHGASTVSTEIMTRNPRSAPSSNTPCRGDHGSNRSIEVVSVESSKEPARFIPPTSPYSNTSTGFDAVSAEAISRPRPPPIITSSRDLQPSKVPASSVGRFFHYGGLAVSLGYGAASELLRRTGASENGESSSLLMNEANIKRLVDKLSRMRGAALKLGQFMSIQDTHILPPDIDKIFRRVQDSAHYMPDWQMEQVLTTSLGPDWSSCFSSFDRIPFAAASIGQVHHAILQGKSGGEKRQVAVKIQFPNIAGSIESDLGYVKLLLTVGRLLPRGLFLDRTIQVMKEELADECNYSREASFLRHFGSPSYLGNDQRFKVPWVWEGSTDRVLVMEHMEGVSVGDPDVSGLSQQDRDDIASRIIELCLKELFIFRVMQTDPNWTNFLWNANTRRIELVDFGATREYSKEFMDNWLHLLRAAAEDDGNGCIEWSQKVGYLTGKENQTMLEAHVTSMTLLATPFKAGTKQPVAFGHGTPWADITAKIREQIPIMLRERLTPPPRETYSLNRKLSGAFLLASRLSAKVDTKELWNGVVGGYQFGDDL